MNEILAGAGILVALFIAFRIFRSGATPSDPATLARLLLTEVKLYNEEALEEARLQHNISSRLREDIRQAREMYKSRVPPEARADHFERPSWTSLPEATGV
jgi:hypothetical protein